MQSLLVELVTVESLGTEQKKQLEALIKLEKINDKAAKTRAEVARMMHSKREEDRKTRTHRLIEQGALFDLANLDNIDKGLLLGGLLHISTLMKSADNTPASQDWKKKGDALLASKEAKKVKAMEKTG